MDESKQHFAAPVESTGSIGARGHSGTAEHAPGGEAVKREPTGMSAGTPSTGMPYDSLEDSMPLSLTFSSSTHYCLSPVASQSLHGDDGLSFACRRHLTTEQWWLGSEVSSQSWPCSGMSAAMAKSSSMPFAMKGQVEASHPNADLDGLDSESKPVPEPLTMDEFLRQHGLECYTASLHGYCLQAVRQMSEDDLMDLLAVDAGMRKVDRKQFLDALRGLEAVLQTRREPTLQDMLALSSEIQNLRQELARSRDAAAQLLALGAAETGGSPCAVQPAEPVGHFEYMAELVCCLVGMRAARGSSGPRASRMAPT